MDGSRHLPRTGIRRNQLPSRSPLRPHLRPQRGSHPQRGTHPLPDGPTHRQRRPDGLAGGTAHGSPVVLSHRGGDGRPVDDAVSRADDVSDDGAERESLDERTDGTADDRRADDGGAESESRQGEFRGGEAEGRGRDGGRRRRRKRGGPSPGGRVFRGVLLGGFDGRRRYRRGGLSRSRDGRDGGRGGTDTDADPPAGAFPPDERHPLAPRRRHHFQTPPRSQFRKQSQTRRRRRILPLRRRQRHLRRDLRNPLAIRFVFRSPPFLLLFFFLVPRRANRTHRLGTLLPIEMRGGSEILLPHLLGPCDFEMEGRGNHVEHGAGADGRGSVRGLDDGGGDGGVERRGFDGGGPVDAGGGPWTGIGHDSDTGVAAERFARSVRVLLEGGWRGGSRSEIGGSLRRSDGRGRTRRRTRRTVARRGIVVATAIGPKTHGIDILRRRSTPPHGHGGTPPASDPNAHLRSSPPPLRFGGLHPPPHHRRCHRALDPSFQLLRDLARIGHSIRYLPKKYHGLLDTIRYSDVVAKEGCRCRCRRRGEDSPRLGDFDALRHGRLRRRRNHRGDDDANETIVRRRGNHFGSVESRGGELE
mmetsp:Transcript_23384/g.48504  ORF Transcript_23384/g.48504 Transcript_23384/m.48504 type:complete len:587 (-) Transcript_23384:415-2175(-)